MTGDPIDRTLVQPAAENARDDQSHRLLYLAGALVVVGVLGLALWAWFSIRGLHDEVTAAEVHADTATSSAQQLYDQVKRLGGTPVVAPPAVQGPTGATGATGAQGLPGRDGSPGQSPPCLFTPSQCVGAAGKDGQPGANGKDGVDGKNGVDGQPGTNGVDGQPGKDGTNGVDGKDGAPGVSVTRVYFDRNADGECRTYNDFSDGRTKVDEGAAGDAACAPAKNPTPAAVLPTGTTFRRRYT